MSNLMDCDICADHGRLIPATHLVKDIMGDRVFEYHLCDYHTPGAIIARDRIIAMTIEPLQV